MWRTPDGIRYDFRHRAVFEIADGTGVVRSAVEPDAEPLDVDAAMRGPVTVLSLLARGIFTLHASAIRVDDCTVALSARGGTGKSTLAHAFARRGYGVVADDAVPINAPEPVAADAALRLWPDALAAFGLHADDHAPVLADAVKRRIAPVRPGDTSIGSPSRIYFLEPDTDEAGPVQIDPIGGAEAGFQILSALSFRSCFDDKLPAATRAAFELAQRARVARIRYRRTWDELDAVVDAIVDDVGSAT